MDGEPHTEAILAYLSRITGSSVSLDRPLQLRSVHRAAFSSWARAQNVPVRLAAIAADAPFTVRDLIGSGASPITVAPAVMSPSAAEKPAFGVGIDIEEVDALPEADDYREHPFFKDHFTAAEISYCLRQRDPRASFCGTWSAKEAILKAGVVSILPNPLNEIEIGHDGLGRPVFPGCSLTISHTPRLAVAVCIVNPMPEIARPVNIPSLGGVDQPVAARGKGNAMAAGWALAAVLAAVLGAALIFGPYLWR